MIMANRFIDSPGLTPDMNTRYLFLDTLFPSLLLISDHLFVSFIRFCIDSIRSPPQPALPLTTKQLSYRPLLPPTLLLCPLQSTNIKSIYPEPPTFWRGLANTHNRTVGCIAILAVIALGATNYDWLAQQHPLLEMAVLRLIMIILHRKQRPQRKSDP